MPKYQLAIKETTLCTGQRVFHCYGESTLTYGEGINPGLALHDFLTRSGLSKSQVNVLPIEYEEEK